MKTKTPKQRVIYLFELMGLTPEDVAKAIGYSVSLVQKTVTANHEYKPSVKFIKNFTQAFQITPENWIEKGGLEVKYIKPDRNQWKDESYRLQEQEIARLTKENERLMSIIENLSKK